LNSSGLQFEVAYSPALAVGGSAQLAAQQNRLYMPEPATPAFTPQINNSSSDNNKLRPTHRRWHY